MIYSGIIHIIPEASPDVFFALVSCRSLPPPRDVVQKAAAMCAFYSKAKTQRSVTHSGIQTFLRLRWQIEVNWQNMSDVRKESTVEWSSSEVDRC